MTFATAIMAAGLGTESIAAAPPTAFRVSPQVMQRLRGAPAPAVEAPAKEEPSAPAAAGPTAEEPTAPAALAAPDLAVPALPSAAGDSRSNRTAPAAAPLSSAPSEPQAKPGPWVPAGEGVSERPWRWIIVHHTATDAGSVEAIHRTHVKRRDGDGNPWLGIGYHFVVGNGDGMGDGEVEPTFRWKDQLAGAHAGRQAENERGIGICLVGDFESSNPTAEQLAATRRLIAFLRDRYDIPADRVIPHDAVKATACPGKRLKIETLLPESSSSATASPAAASSAPAVPAPSHSWDDDEDFLPTGLSAPEVSSGPTLAAPVSSTRSSSTRSSLAPRSGSQDAP
ncbi:peptidoglycan recognition protein family protein [Alienimonas chondri]|uniref:peptidoglycan recognition protein family protein n=1 Tax=Alienimonas chondri TaxID=2681879 RepID=UPI0014881B70|nr:peptidoglycan recognition family protein [Alienimonas chondri]